jgi:hypothetical protein
MADLLLLQQPSNLHRTANATNTAKHYSHVFSSPKQCLLLV